MGQPGRSTYNAVTHGLYKILLSNKFRAIAAYSLQFAQNYYKFPLSKYCKYMDTCINAGTWKCNLYIQFVKSIWRCTKLFKFDSAVVDYYKFLPVIRWTYLNDLFLCPRFIGRKNLTTTNWEIAIDRSLIIWWRSFNTEREILNFTREWGAKFLWTPPI